MARGAARRSRTPRAVPAKLYRVCLHMEGGRAHACSTDEPQCYLCSITEAMTRAQERGHQVERSLDETRRGALTYRETLEADGQQMALVRAAEAGIVSRIGTATCALMLLREHGSVEAALYELTSQPEVYDHEYFRVVEVELKLMDVPMSDHLARHAELLREVA